MRFRSATPFPVTALLTYPEKRLLVHIVHMYSIRHTHPRLSCCNARPRGAKSPSSGRRQTISKGWLASMGALIKLIEHRETVVGSQCVHGHKAIGGLGDTSRISPGPFISSCMNGGYGCNGPETHATKPLELTLCFLNTFWARQAPLSNS